MVERIDDALFGEDSMGGISVTFNVPGTLLLCLIQGNFLRHFMAYLLLFCFYTMVLFIYEDDILGEEMYRDIT